ncbi:cytidylyltransferase domain-containing protein [Ulvibacterium sp.]|uniref:acylneuraminate cytidylyltransferase family protein n=1 Tax=Ulvibacterium sp. TaxID=2665914 RepID=UPI003CC583C0
MQPLVLIPARGGSKGVPHKNIKVLAGKPLLGHTIMEAQKVFKYEQIVVSTDSPEIKSVAENFGIKVPFLRPTNLAKDTSGSYGVIMHCIGFFEKKGYHADVLVLLQPTSPFRKANHIRECLELYTPNLDMVVSVKETKANPYFNLFEENNKGYLEKSKKADYERRQDAPKVWEYNGAIYLINVDSLKKGNFSSFKKIKKYVMGEIPSFDIDTQLDWEIAKQIAENNIK